ncbi:MAG: UPF0149 family protein [Burkholderiales bacterium]|nr:UPF0149 family protein [Burkholderiales bacterium]
MSADTSIHMPLTDIELDELEAFLTSDAVSEDCMNLEMLDGFLTACVCSPCALPTSQWLQAIWGGPSENSVGAAFSSAEQAQRILELIMRHWSTLNHVLSEMPTLYKPLLYFPENHPSNETSEDEINYEAHDWCFGFMTGVILGGDAWAPLMENPDTADWLFPIEALAFGDHDPTFGEWIDDIERRESLVDELPIAAVLIYRFWAERAQKKTVTTHSAESKRAKKTTKKPQERLH